MSMRFFPSKSIRILLLNSDALARAGMKLLLESQPRLVVSAQAGDAKQAVELARQAKPEMILIHENGGVEIDLDFISEIWAIPSQARIILITPNTDPQYHIQAVKKGVVGILGTTQTPNVLFKAIEKVHAGEFWLDRSLIASVVVQASQPVRTNPNLDKIALLTAREREVISLIGEGLKNQEIAGQLFLSEVTIRHHLTSIFKKLGVADRLELVIYAYQNGLAQLPE